MFDNDDVEGIAAKDPCAAMCCSTALLTFGDTCFMHTHINTAIYKSTISICKIPIAEWPVLDMLMRVGCFRYNLSA